MNYDIRFRSLLAGFCLLASVLVTAAADRITATVTVTNTAIADDTFIINGATRTWKVSVASPSIQIVTGADEFETTTNLIAQLLAYPAAGVTVYQLGAASFRLDGITGAALTIGGAGDYFSVSYSTQTVTSAYTVIVPPTATPSVRRQTVTEGIVDWLNLTSAKAIFENSTSVSNLVGRTNDQSIAGIKEFRRFENLYWGSVSNSPSVTSTNGQFHVIAMRDSFSGNFSNLFTFTLGALFVNSATLNLPNTSILGDLLTTGNFTASNSFSVFGASASVTGTFDGTAGLYFHSAGGAATNFMAALVATQAVTAPILVASESAEISRAAFNSTNNFPAGSDISFGRYAVTSLANGNNAGVPVGTNVFVEVSGPSGAFAINGINGQPNRDGKLLILVNQTGQDMTIAHQSGVDATAANRIITMTGADRATTGNGAATFIYSGTASRWILVSFDP